MVTADDSDIDLVLVKDDWIAVGLAPGTTIVMPWQSDIASRQTSAEVSSGTARFRTGPSFEGDRLMIRTDEAEVSVTGTTLAVIRDSDGTHACSFKGSIALGSQGGTLEAVPSGKRQLLYRDGRRGTLDPLSDAEARDLAQFFAGAERLFD